MPKDTDRPKTSDREDRTALLKCPKCAAPMQPVVHQGIEVDRCTACRGLWFDLLEHEDLKGKDDSEALDFGDPAQGKKNDKLQDVECPVCHAKMLKMVDRDRKDIHFEACAACYGVYFDAGEFKDWKKHHAFDWLKSLLARERK